MSRTVRPTSSLTSRATAASSDSPGSTNPARHEYIGTFHSTPRASSASWSGPSSPRVTRVIIAGASRGKADRPHGGAAHRPLALGRLAGRAAAPAEAVGAAPLDELHGSTGGEPGGLAGAAVEAEQVDGGAVARVGDVGGDVDGVPDDAVEHPDDMGAPGRVRRRGVDPDRRPDDVDVDRPGNALGDDRRRLERAHDNVRTRRGIRVLKVIRVPEDAKPRLRHSSDLQHSGGLIVDHFSQDYPRCMSCPPS